MTPALVAPEGADPNASPVAFELKDILRGDNSEEAFAGHVFEVHDLLGLQGVATLSELYEHDGTSEVNIKLKDGCVRLRREADGTWAEVPAKG